MAEFAVTVIGSGSALPMNGRNPSAQVVQYDDIFLLIDCGEGTQTRLRDAGIKPFRINVILISHLHGDHVFGLPGLLSSFSHLQRQEELIVFGPAGIKGLIHEIRKYTEMKINYPLEIIESDVDDLTEIWTKGNVVVYTFPLQHRIPCNGYLVKEKRHVRKLNKEAIAGLHLNPDQLHQLQEGLDIEINGEVIKNQQLTHVDEGILSYAYCSDTQFSERIIPWIKDVSLLYHETTFKDELTDTAILTGHSTAGEAGRMAKACGAKCLLTGHYSSRYKDVSDILTEARVYFPNVHESVEGFRYPIRSLVKQG